MAQHATHGRETRDWAYSDLISKECGLRKLDFETLFHTGSTQFKETSSEPVSSSFLVLTLESKRSC